MCDTKHHQDAAVKFLISTFIGALIEGQAQPGNPGAPREYFERTLREKHKLSDLTIDMTWRTMCAAYRLGAEDQMNGDFVG